jgi:hypothetical protein
MMKRSPLAARERYSENLLFASEILIVSIPDSKQVIMTYSQYNTIAVAGSHCITYSHIRSQEMVPTIDGKVLRGTRDEEQNGVYLLAAYLPAEGLVLLEVEVAGKGARSQSHQNY